MPRAIIVEKKPTMVLLSTRDGQLIGQEAVKVYVNSVGFILGNLHACRYLPSFHNVFIEYKLSLS